MMRRKNLQGGVRAIRRQSGVRAIRRQRGALTFAYQYGAPGGALAVALALSAALAVALLLGSIMPAGAKAPEMRPVNFIFLVDVSGSMVMKSTMVRAQDGKNVTLFEALREALKQMVGERRLINSASRVIFITFGTEVKEKEDWPSTLDSDEKRSLLIEKISSPETLSADRHGDTYMGGALKLAFDRAQALVKEGDPCTTTFFVMLTDGWDEPPANAQYKVKEVAKDLLAKKKEIESRLGVDTWQVRVIGLQRLPDTRAGTTTAKELAGLLGGAFVDVNARSGGTVSDRIFAAVKETVESIKGDIRLGTAYGAAGGTPPAGEPSRGEPSRGTSAGEPSRGTPSSAGAGRGAGLKQGFIDFGSVEGSGISKTSIPLVLSSCYQEDVTGVDEVSSRVSEEIRNEALSRLKKIGGDTESYKLVSSLPGGAVTVHLDSDTVTLAPRIPGKSYEEGGAPKNSVELRAHAHSNCPAGHYLGFLKLSSTARVPDFVPYYLSVPTRLVIEPELPRARVRKPGFFFAEGTSIELDFKIRQSPGAARAAMMNIDVSAGAPSLVSRSGKDSTAPVIIAEKRINSGKTLSYAFDTRTMDEIDVKIPVEISADQKPGLYSGVIKVNVRTDAESQSPAHIVYELSVQPSSWEEVEPVAVPILIIFFVVIGLSMALWLATIKRQRH